MKFFYSYYFLSHTEGKKKSLGSSPRSQAIYTLLCPKAERILIAKASFIIRTLPSVEESHLIGGKRVTLRRLSQKHYCRYGICLLKHSRTAREDKPHSHYSLFLRIRYAKNSYQLFLSAHHSPKNLFCCYLLYIICFFVLFPRCPKRTSGKLLSI